MFNIEIAMNYWYRSLHPKSLPDSRQLIFGQHTDSITVATDYPDIKFILDEPKNRKLDNVSSVMKIFGHILTELFLQ